MLEYEFLNKHWYKYYKLEEEFLEIEKTIPVDSNNFETFSYSYMKLLVSICNEFNNCFKNFAKFNNEDCNSINQYKKFINVLCPDFINMYIVFYKWGCERHDFYPFEDWIGENNLFWWEINNAVKHNRNNIETNQTKENYKLVNQKCILTALSGLYQLNIFFYTNIVYDSSSFEILRETTPNSKIFSIGY